MEIIKLFTKHTTGLCILSFLFSCQHGYYLPRTANIPQLDSNKRSDINFKLGANSIELQQNHLISNKLVFQNNIAYRPPGTLYEGFAGLGEVGLGYYLHNNYTSLLLLGAGYSYQNFEYLYSEFGGSSYIIINAPKQYNAFAQYSKTIAPTSVNKINVSFYERTDFCFMKDTKMSYRSNYDYDIPYLVQDFGTSVYVRPVRLNLNMGIKYAYTWHDKSRFDAPLLIEYLLKERKIETKIYCRLSFRF